MSLNRLYNQCRPRLVAVVTRLVKDERGQSTAEYILMLSVVVLIALRFKRAFTGKISQLSEKIFGQIDKAVEEEP